MDASENLNFSLLEDLLNSPGEIPGRFKDILDETGGSKFGFELDCDSIVDFPSSAKSPSGFSINEVRNLIRQVSKKDNCCYFHICEAAPNEDNASQVGKALSYFISDFISEK